MSKIYVAYWDCLGFENITCVSDIDKRRMWAQLQNKSGPTQLALGHMIMRAKANPQRSPEIWQFTSDLDLKTLIEYSQEHPQALVDSIRELGNVIFKTPKTEKVIE